MIEEIQEIINNYNKIKEEMIDSIETNKRVINLKLEKLRDNRDKEISEYIQDTMISKPSFYAGYGATIRKDLEQAYVEQEKKLLDELKGLDDELVIAKNNLRQNLLEKKNEINSLLKSEQVKFDNIMLELSDFKYEYDDNHVPTNGQQWREIYEKGNDVIDVLNEYRKVLRKIDEELGLNELTDEEIKVIMSIKTTQKGPKNELTESDFKYDPKDVKEVDDPIKVMPFEESEDKLIVENYAELLKVVFNDIMSQLEGIQSVNLSASNKNYDSKERYIGSKGLQVGTVNLGEKSLQLPNGMYINEEEFTSAVDKYAEKNKGRTFVVKEINKKYKISNVDKFRKVLKQCSTVRLVKEGKMGKADLIRVHGKEYAENMVENIGNIKTEKNIAIGDFISRDEVIASMTELFQDRKLVWLKNFSDKLKDLRKVAKDKLTKVEKSPVREIESSKQR